MPTAAQSLLTGRRGWAVVTTLSLVLSLLVADQLPGRDASAEQLVAVATSAPAAPRLDDTDRPFPRPELAQQAAAPAPAPAPAPAARSSSSRYRPGAP